MALKQAKLITPSLYQPDKHPFFTRQLKIVLENSGKIDPEKIEEYIAADGYKGLYKVLREMTAESVVEAITNSGLRGRGGGGYPTGLKWSTVAKSTGERKFVICNADEGDPGAAFDTPVDYESLTKLGSIMGSGGAIVMDETTNIVDVARFFMEFCMDESCGKCIPCRAGTVQLYQLLTKIREGKASMKDLEQLEELCDMVKHTSLCGLGQSAPNPVLSTLRYFSDEYLALVSDRQLNFNS